MAHLLVLHVADEAFCDGGTGVAAVVRGLVEHDVGLGPLAGVVVGDAHDGDVLDVGVAEQEVLELGGRDADTLDLDHLLEAVGDGDEALGVDGADVACVQEAVPVERLARRLGVVQVAHDDLGPAGPDLAGLVEPAFAARVRLDDLDLGARDDGADAERVLVVVFLGRVRRDAAARLGHAVALFEAGAGKPFLQQFEDLGRQGRRAGGEAPQRRQVVFRERLVVAHHADQDRRHQQHLLQLVFLHRGQHAVHGESGQHVDICVEQHGQVHLVH